jgi:hypothetical protein
MYKVVANAGFNALRSRQVTPLSDRNSRNQAETVLGPFRAIGIERLLLAERGPSQQSQVGINPDRPRPFKSGLLQIIEEFSPPELATISDALTQIVGTSGCALNGL